MIATLRRLLRAIFSRSRRPARRGDFVVVERNGLAYVELRRPQ